MFNSVPATLLPLEADGVTCLSQAATSHDSAAQHTDTPRWERGDMDEQTYDYRVRALEDQLGVSSSDAQAMVDAEELLAQRRK